jgi:hypothetical protein
MRTFVKILLTIVLLIGGAVVWYKISYPTYTYRYRMTVEVMVDGAVRSGTSVIEVKVQKQPKFGQAPPQVSRFYGEAVFVDLGGGRNVIALLAAGPKAEDVDYSYNVVPTLFGLTFKDEDLAKLADLQGAREVPAAHMPTFVTFPDLNDPKTVRVVGLGEFEDVFGPDVHFKQVWIEMTGDPVTGGIEKKLLWWGKPLPWVRPTGPNTGVDTRPFVPGKYRLMSEQFRRSS